ncbi:MAG TPA: DUF2336 domain-containing protein [Alphaproteobacteria bacterium]|nr:DUF2336 domain-containing protein [Alphaproteobacteria bacterium]
MVLALSVNTVEQLLSLARDKTVAARTRLAETVSDLFFDQAKVLSDRERTLMIDILRQLIHDAEMSVRRTLAERLADKSSAPRELIVELANDQIEVAYPILVKSDALHDAELIEIVRHRTLEHQLAITLRRSLSEPVSDALVETNNPAVVTSLLENPNAQISRMTLEYLVEESKRIDSYQNPLLRRNDLPPALAKRMYYWVSAALRKHILDKFAIDPTELDDSLESSIRSILGDDTSASRPTAELAEALIKSHAATPQFLVKVLREGEIPLFEALLSRLTGLRDVLLRRFMFEPGGEALAIACRAIGIEKAVFATIFLLSRKARPGDQIVDPNEVSQVLDFYDRLDIPAAKNLLRRWQRDPDFLDAIRRLESPNAKKPRS